MTSKVTNNHNAPLSIAGVTIKAGGSAGIEEGVLRNALSSNGIKTWLRLGLIEVEGVEELAKGSEEKGIPGIPGVSLPNPADQKSDERVALEAKASELGVQGNIGRMKDETLEAKIAEAEEANQ